MHQRQEPRARLRPLRHEPVGVAPRREEPFLYHVLGELLVADDSKREPVGDPTEPVVQLGEGGLVRARDEGDDRLV